MQSYVTGCLSLPYFDLVFVFTFVDSKEFIFFPKHIRLGTKRKSTPTNVILIYRRSEIVDIIFILHVYASVLDIEC